MNLELLLSLSCIFSNSQPACIAMGEGYYKYEKLDQIAENVERQYPNFVFSASLLSSIEKRKASVPIYNGSYFSCEFPEGAESKLTVGWNHGF